MSHLLKAIWHTLRLALWLSLAWCLLGLGFIVLVPAFEDEVRARALQYSGLSLDGAGLEGYFYFHRLGMRMRQPRFSDEEGLLLEARALELELNPLSQWRSGNLLPLLVNLHGAKLQVEQGPHKDQWALQQRYHFGQPPSPGAGDQGEGTSTQAQEEGEAIDMSQLDLGSDLDEMLGLFALFAGRINILDTEATLLRLVPGSEHSHTVSGINLAVQGGEEPEISILIDSPRAYSQRTEARISVERIPRGYLQMRYLVDIANFDRPLLDILYPEHQVPDDLRASIRLSGSLNPIHQTHEFTVDIREGHWGLGAKRPPLHHFSASGLIDVSDNSLRVELPSILFQYGSPSLDQHLLIEDLGYTDSRNLGEIVGFNFGMKRLRLDHRALEALIDLKNRFAPKSMPGLDEIAADIDMRKLRISVDLANKTVFSADGQIQVNHLQIEEGTEFSNLGVYISDLDGKLTAQVNGQASLIAIAGILQPSNFHNISGMSISMGEEQGDWLLSVRAPKVWLTPQHSLDLSSSVEFKPGYSPWIRLRLFTESIPVEVLRVYLPDKLLNPALNRWLWEALVEGTVAEASVEYGGNVMLSEPEIRPEVFSLSVHLTETRMRFWQDWPVFDDVDGLFDVRDGALRYKATMRYYDTDINIEGGIPDFSRPELHAHFKFRGNYATTEHFALSTPLADSIEKMTSPVDVGGYFDIDSDFWLDLTTLEARLDGQLEIDGMWLELLDLSLVLVDIYGLLHFTTDSVRSEGLRALFSDDILNLNINTVEEMGARRISLDLTTNQSPHNVLGMAALLDSLGITGRSDWYLRFLSPSIDPPTDPRTELNKLRSFLFFHSDFVGVSIADSSSINKGAAEIMPVAGAVTDTDFGDRVVWLVLDEVLDGRIFLGAFEEEEGEVSAAYARLAQGGESPETLPFPASPFLPPPPGDGTAQASGVDDEAALRLTTLLTDEGHKQNLETVRAMANRMWTRMLEYDFLEKLVNREITVDGELEYLRLQPWIKGFTAVAEEEAVDEAVDEADDEASEDEDSDKDSDMVYRVKAKVGYVDSFGIDFNDVNFSMLFAEDNVGVTIDSQEGLVNFYYDTLRLEPMQIDIERLDYKFPKRDADSDEPARDDDAKESLGEDGPEEGADALAQDLAADEGQAAAETADGGAIDASVAEPADPGEEAEIAASGAIDASAAEPADPGEEAEIAASGAIDASAAEPADPGEEAEIAASDAIDASVAEPADPGEEAEIAASGAIDASAAEPADPGEEAEPPLLSQEQYHKIFDGLAAVGEIDFYCRQCKVNQVSLKNIEISMKASESRIDTHMRYGSEGLEDSLIANITWMRKQDDMYTKVVVNANSDDVYKSVANHGAKSFAGGEGEIKLVASWDDAPTELHYPSLSGDITVNLENGALYGLGSSSGQRLLSIVNLLEIPRRFSLDFSDLGLDLQFYTAHLAAEIDSGVVNISEQDPLLLRSSLGTMETFGDIDLGQQRYYIGAHLVPNVVTYTAPVLALLLLGPLAGVSMVGINWTLSAFGVDSNTIAQQYSIIDTSFDDFEIDSVTPQEFREWAAQLNSPASGAVEPAPAAPQEPTGQSPPEASEAPEAEPAAPQESASQRTPPPPTRDGSPVRQALEQEGVAHNQGLQP